jgi:hypothetical protein
LHRTEQLGGRKYGKPRLNYRLWCHRKEVDVNDMGLKD